MPSTYNTIGAGPVNLVNGTASTTFSPTANTDVEADYNQSGNFFFSYGTYTQTIGASKTNQTISFTSTGADLGAWLAVPPIT